MFASIWHRRDSSVTSYPMTNLMTFHLKLDIKFVLKSVKQRKNQLTNRDTTKLHHLTNCGTAKLHHHDMNIRNNYCNISTYLIIENEIIRK